MACRLAYRRAASRRRRTPGRRGIVEPRSRAAPRRQALKSSDASGQRGECRISGSTSPDRAERSRLRRTAVRDERRAYRRPSRTRRSAPVRIGGIVRRQSRPPEPRSAPRRRAGSSARSRSPTARARMPGRRLERNIHRPLTVAAGAPASSRALDPLWRQRSRRGRASVPPSVRQTRLEWPMRHLATVHARSPRARGNPGLGRIELAATRGPPRLFRRRLGARIDPAGLRHGVDVEDADRHQDRRTQDDEPRRATSASGEASLQHEKAGSARTSSIRSPCVLPRPTIGWFPGAGRDERRLGQPRGIGPAPRVSLVGRCSAAEQGTLSHPTLNVSSVHANRAQMPNLLL